MTLTRKIQIVPVGNKDEKNRVYKYLREGIEAQNKAMNEYISALYTATLMEITKEDRKELNNLFGRISTSKKGSGYDSEVQLPKGYTAGNITQAVQQDFANAMKKGLMFGRISLPTYRKDNPLMVHIDYIRLAKTNPHSNNGLYHNYKSDDEFLNHLYKNDLEIFIKYANHITFQIVFGNPHRSAELRSVFKNIFDSTYEVKGSSIEIKSNGKIMLNLTLEIPKQELELDENTVVGVDLGLAIPAYCALNNSEYVKLRIGSFDDFMRVRTQINNQRQRLQSKLKMAQGGHGRNKKLKAMDKFRDYESNWVKNYNHFVSKQVVNFAVKNKAKYINLEDLSGFDKNEKLLRYWSYYQLQQFIEYKAAKYGIIVRKINPYHTSQICSCCGHWEEGQRVSQNTFICKNPKCKNHDSKVNADFNAARNIAISNEFIKQK